MFKKILIIVFILFVAAYLVAAMTHFNVRPEWQKCKQIEVIIKDTSDVDLLTKSGIVQTLQKRGIKLIGKKMDAIDTKVLEKDVHRFPLVSNVECYKTLGGKIRIEVTQRIPILHVMNDNGEDYFLDNMGHVLPTQSVYMAYRPIVTGRINKWFAVNFLYKLGVFIYYNPFWRAAIQQINVLPGYNIELVPRMGNHIIYLGSIDHFDDKLNRLKIFYEQGLNKVGWNKYLRISLEFNNQIICTKRAAIAANDSINKK